ncbi:CMGC/CDK protein kinase [Phytophthora cinnamomi]|uniref:CMGC/CDK protein kinase n=1 Tax=Phytophthora cinnamomi TaxID=4785 RepID=UPI00355937D4|nr:CMGC/CDK protein kinase [Phytophthora cinnamomi]
MARSSSRSRSRSRSRSAEPEAQDASSTSFDQLQALRHVQLIERNEYPLRHLARDKVRRRARASRQDDEEDEEDDGALCFCALPDAVEREDARRRGERVRRCDDVSCLNFATYVECSPSCAAGAFCRNQRLQHPERYPQLEPFRTEHKGYGVRTRERIGQLSIVGEYVGEIIDQKELARRLKSVPRHELNFYYLLLAPGVYIDARSKGSFTRFVNHSCEPNCKTEKWTVKGETRIAVIALTDIDVGEELTFDYQWKALGSRQIKCFCGAPSCKGVIGAQNDALKDAEAQTGYFRDPEKQETGRALVGKRVRVFLSPEDKTEYDVQLIKAYDEDQDRYEVEDLLEPAGYETDENDAEEEQEVGEKQYVQLKENGWQLYCPPEEREGDTVFAIPKKRLLPTSSGRSSAAGSREPSPKREVMSQSPVDTPSPVAMAKLESSFTTAKKNQYGEPLDRDGKIVSKTLLVKFLPKEYDARGLRSLFVSRKHPNALVDADVFHFLDGTGWALVELESNELAASFRRTLDRRNLLDKMLRVYQAGAKELENYRYQKGKVQVMRQQASTDKNNTSPSEEKENVQVVERQDPYCFGRKLNWLVTEEELKNLSVQQVLSASLEETLRVKYVKSIFHIAKGLRLDREDATSAIIALNRFFTFHAMPMEVDIYAATMLHLFLKAHARNVPWTAFVKEVYKAKHGAAAAERLTAASPELGVLKRHLVKAEGELLEGLHYDVTGEDPYALLDLLTTRKSSKKLVTMSQDGFTQQVTPFLSSLPPPEVQKEAKHLVAEALPLPIWTRTPVECVMLSVVYVSAAVTEALSPSSATPMTRIPDFLPQLDLQANTSEARMLLDCSLSICTQLKDRWLRLEKQSKASQQQKQKQKQKQTKNADSSEFDLEQFAVSKDKKDVEISERITRLLKHWINLPTPTVPSVLSVASAVSSVPMGMRNFGVTAPTQSGVKNFITFKAMGSSVPVPSSSTGQINEAEAVISALSIFPQKSAASDTIVGDTRLHTDEITKVESIRKRAFLGIISSEVNLDLAGQSVYLQSWPYLEQEVFFTEERGINEACLRELSAATTLSSLLPDRFMKLYGIIFPADRKDRQANESGATSNKPSSTATTVDELDLLAATIDDDGNPLPEGIDRLTRQKHYLAFEQPLHMFSGIFEAHVSLTPELRKKAIFDMLQSLSAVHDQGYVHRFVAPSHLLVFKNGIKLGGFHAMRKIANIKPKDGEGSSMAAYEMTDGERKEHCYGAWLYVTAPEVLLGETKYSWRADVWSAGCVALAILLEKVPFLQGPDIKVQLDLIYRLCGTPSSSWEGAHKLPLYSTFRPKHEYKMRLRKTLLEQRSKFPEFPEDAVEVLEAMLQLDPSRRCTVKKLLEMRYFDSVRSSGRTFDFSGLPSTFPVQKKKLVQHLLKSKAKKHRSAGSSSRSSGSARPSHHHSSHRHSNSDHHRHKRSASSAHDGSSSGGDKSSHHDRHRPRTDKRKSRSLSTSRREVKHAMEDVEMQDASEYVPLPASFTASAGYSPSQPMVDTDDSLPRREKRVKLGWGMGLNSES